MSSPLTVTRRGFRLARVARVVALAVLASGVATVPSALAGARSNAPEQRLSGPGCVAAASADAYSTPQDVQLLVGAPGVMANDTPCGGIVSVHILPSHGTLNLQADGSFVYTPDPGYSGPDSFVYSLLSGAAAPPANVQITVEPAPVCAPVAIDDAYDTPQDVALNVAVPGVKGNDTHCDFFVHLYSNPSNGTLALNADGSFQYTPNAGFSGVDSFEYALAASMPGFASGRGRGALGWHSPRGAADNVATVTITVATPAPTTTSPPVTTTPSTTTGTLPATR